MVLKITVYYKTVSTGVDSAFLSPLDPNGLTNIYSIDGKLLRANVVRRDVRKNLSKGIYIIDKQKIMIGY